MSDVDNKATRGMALLSPGLGPAMVGVPQVSVLTPGSRLHLGLPAITTAVTCTNGPIAARWYC